MTTRIRIVIGIALVVWLAIALGVRRDDSSQHVRFVVSDVLSLPYEKVPLERTLGELECNLAQFESILEQLQKSPHATLPIDSDPRLSGEGNHWQDIRLTELADWVRPQWSRDRQ